MMTGCLFTNSEAVVFETSIRVSLCTLALGPYKLLTIQIVSI
jgi:hypothetical protein